MSQLNQSLSSHSHSTTGTYSSASFNPVNVTWNIKKCRGCKHGHFQGSNCCAQIFGSMISLVQCPCTEYVPENNLEFLEWKFNKNEAKKQLPNL